MPNKLLILKGSPREKGNSAVLADQAAAGAAAAGWSVESVSLQSLDIRPCDGCDLCTETAEFCVIDDDMQRLYPKLLTADALILATPIYWFTFSAQLKLCIDRWYGLWIADHHAFERKRIGLILAYGDSDLHTSGAINALHTFESMFGFLQADIVGVVHGSLADVGDAEQHPQLLSEAYDLGRKITGQPVEAGSHA
jgi:multimeric flavodoxin WrbA